MKIFAGVSNVHLAQAIAKDLKLSLSHAELHVFPDGEQRVMLKVPVLDEDVVIVQSTGMPTDVNYIQLLFMIDAAKRSGAKSITVVIPYLGYSRQDHVFRDGEARSLEVMIRLMEQAGGDRFIAFDLHSIKIPEVFHKPLTHLSALPLFAAKIKELGFLTEDTVLVSPDMGGMRRLSILSEMLSGMPTASVEKNRDLTTGKIDASAFHGEIKRRCLIIDDMISSGKTIVQAVDILRGQGAEEIYVFATHPIFSENASYLLQISDALKIFVTDTIFVPEEKRFEKLEILSIAPQLSASL